MPELGEKTAKLEFQYKTVLDLGKFMYDSYFKLAAMSFTLNGLLLGSVAFFLPQAGKLPDRLYGLGITTVGAVGLIYNLGALLTYASLVTLAGNLAARFAKLDRLLNLDVRSCRTTVSNWLGSVSILLTVAFFLAWIFIWTYVILYIPDTQSNVFRGD
jgi:hypothetical protein